MTFSLPMSSPDLSAIEMEAVQRVLATRHLSIGPQLTAFEEAFAAYVGTKYAVGVNSGTSGLHLCVIAAGVQENDLVITTPFSFIASANCILYERGIPVFVDVEPQTGNLDPEKVQQAVEDITQGRPERWLPPALRGNGARSVGALRAILPVHAFGQPANMDAMRRTAAAHGLTVIEDACEAIGATYQGQAAGTLSQVAVFAFYPNKQMTTGEGGMIVTDDEGWFHLFRSLRNQGRDVFDAWLKHTRLGYNYRLDEMSAALGLTQLNRLDELLEKRAAVAAHYDERLAEMELITRPFVAPATTRMSWFVYVVRVKPPADRNVVMQQLAERGIPSRPYFTPIHLQPFYRQQFGYRPGDFPVTEMLGETSLALPFSSVMTGSQVDQVCDTLRKVLNHLPA